MKRASTSTIELLSFLSIASAALVNKKDVSKWLKLTCLSVGDAPERCEEVASRPSWGARKKVLQALHGFAEVYRRRPISFNFGGMNLNHIFSMWYTVYSLQPRVVVESGVWRGQGTWFIRQAAPSARIICVDPGNKYGLKYRDPNATYLWGKGREGPKLYNFHDIGEVDWNREELIPDAETRSHTLFILDDHQSAIKRMMQLMRPWGFRHFWYEDNWSRGPADCYSFATLCARDPPVEGSVEDASIRKLYDQASVTLFPTAEVVYRDNLNRVKVAITRDEHEANVAFLLGHIDAYFECPAVHDVCSSGTIFASRRQGPAVRPLLPIKAEVDALFADNASTNLFGEVGSLLSNELITLSPPYVRLRFPINETLWNATTPCLRTGTGTHFKRLCERDASATAYPFHLTLQGAGKAVDGSL